MSDCRTFGVTTIISGGLDLEEETRKISIHRALKYTAIVGKL
jgi:hypothetical protein